MSREIERDLTFSTTCPWTILHSLGVNVICRHAGNRMRWEIREDGGYRWFNDERYQKQKSEYRENRRRTHTERSIELSFLDHSTDLGLLLLDAHYHRRLVGINDCGFLWVTWTLLAILSKFSEDLSSITRQCARNYVFTRNSTYFARSLQRK